MSEYLIVDLRNKPELKELAAEWEIVGTFLLSRYWGQKVSQNN